MTTLPDVDVGTPAEGDTGVDAGEDSGVRCSPATHYSFTLPQPVGLLCASNPAATIFVAPVNATGYALARATFSVTNDGTVSPVTHFWNVAVTVGEAVLAEGIGDGVCAGSSRTRTNLGYGALSAAAPNVTVQAFEGADPCTDGANVITSMTLDVWVESSDPACEGTAIQFASYYEQAGETTFWDWPTDTAPIVSGTFASTVPNATLRVLSVIEGTPDDNPDSVCGAETAALVSLTTLDDGITATSEDVVGAGMGMGHLVLSTDSTTIVQPGTHSFGLQAGKDFLSVVTTGGCCGDGEIAAIWTE